MLKITKNLRIVSASTHHGIIYEGVYNGNYSRRITLSDLNSQITLNGEELNAISNLENFFKITIEEIPQNKKEKPEMKLLFTVNNVEYTLTKQEAEALYDYLSLVATYQIKDKENFIFFIPSHLLGVIPAKTPISVDYKNLISLKEDLSLIFDKAATRAF